MPTAPSRKTLDADLAIVVSFREASLTCISREALRLIDALGGEHSVGKRGSADRDFPGSHGLIF